MKSIFLTHLVLTIILFTSCTQPSKVGPKGEPGKDGIASIYSSPWYTPTLWEGNSWDWYFDIEDPAISENVVETGIILAYMSVPDDLYETAVRPMPAYAIGANWDFLIPDYGQIEFTCDSQEEQGTDGYYFRFVVIPSDTQLKSTNKKSLCKDDLMAMEYKNVCALLNIEE